MTRFHKVYIITIPKNTTDLKRIIEGTVLSGKITFMHIDIPDGWDYNAGIQIKFGRHIFPDEGSDANDTYTGNDNEFPLRPNIELNEDKLEIFGRNLDTLLDHTCTVLLEIEQGES